MTQMKEHQRALKLARDRRWRKRQRFYADLGKRAAAMPIFVIDRDGKQGLVYVLADGGEETWIVGDPGGDFRIVSGCDPYEHIDAELYE